VKLAQLAEWVKLYFQTYTAEQTGIASEHEKQQAGCKDCASMRRNSV